METLAREGRSQHANPGPSNSTQVRFPPNKSRRKGRLAAAPRRRRQPAPRMLSRSKLPLQTPGAGEPPGSLSTLSVSPGR